ncbi:MAG: UDP-N-acetylglucosamine 2-epimerase (non-hydrolyzing) [Ilumatobacteraceae bacterium]|nr:UDP-N-acetylglucosamine 2-epimerase (non-hydrolyzing) [Ilumatobacter sp.]MCB0981296.1 UDP-N-acetylglucosamine 2-epimerase (non-hydrolyzing) [Ilumatobacter sp.]MCO5329545.1 UDP-N-acetylglucosamine 2-epimerase (non-hydrolyzing) [Ilumatobacteraceae bacterium]
MTRLAVIAGARPNFMKVAPILRACAAQGVEALLVHTGQHYDATMSGSFFDVLGLPQADVNFGVGSGSHAVQTAAVMTAFEEWVQGAEVDAVVVVGDVNSTMACTIVAAKLGIPVAHVEAGLRSFDRTMPEEVNRAVTDALATWLFATSDDAVANLLAEGAEPARVHLVGNVMADSLFHAIDRARQRQPWTALGLPERFGLVTLHRPALVDDPARLGEMLDALGAFADRLPFVFPVHPRTRANIERNGLPVAGLHLVEPLDYLDFLAMQEHAAVVVTDSGGVQEETSLLGTWCITVRENTERPVTVTLGTNTLVGFDLGRMSQAIADALDRGDAAPAAIPFWDGRAAERIVAILRQPPPTPTWIPPSLPGTDGNATDVMFA